MSNREQLVALVTNLEHSISQQMAACPASRSPFAAPLDKSIQEFPPGVVAALDRLQSFVDRDDLPEDCWALTLAAETLLREAADRRAGELCDWPAYAALLDARRPPQRRHIESPSVLHGQGVNAAQIAKVFGWRSWNGDPDTAKVADELRNPGRHFHSDEHEHPADRADRESLARQWDDRVQRRQAAQQAIAAAAQPLAPPKRRESLDELLEQRVNVNQICKMTGLTEADVFARADLIGANLEVLPRPKNGLTSVRRATHEADQRTIQSNKLRTLDTHPEAGDWPARINAMRADGCTDRQIADVMRLNHGYSMSHAWRLIRPLPPATA